MIVSELREALKGQPQKAEVMLDDLTGRKLYLHKTLEDGTTDVVDLDVSINYYVAFLKESGYAAISRLWDKTREEK